MNQSGPADCVEEPSADASGNSCIEHGNEEVGSNCAGALQGGVDGVAAVDLWDLKTYKVAQLCDKELRRANATGEGDARKQLLCHDRAEVIAFAVEALSKLQQT